MQMEIVSHLEMSVTSKMTVKVDQTRSSVDHVTLSITRAAGTTAAMSDTPGADTEPTAARCQDRTTPLEVHGDL